MRYRFSTSEPADEESNSGKRIAGTSQIFRKPPQLLVKGSRQRCEGAVGITTDFR